MSYAHELGKTLREVHERGRPPWAAAAERLIRDSGCCVLQWRKRNSGMALTDSDWWYIEVPPPRGPVSFGTFAHEVGHQLLHRTGRRPRWLEEVEAWEYALGQWPRFGLPGYATAQADAAASLAYAAAKAIKRSNAPIALAAKIRVRYPAWVDVPVQLPGLRAILVLQQ